MSWSHVEFERKEMVACENIGRLSVTLVRTGDISTSSYVSISVKEVSAKEGEDFIITSAAQVQFDPGKRRFCTMISFSMLVIPQKKFCVDQN